jgi:hypothetical protein
MAYIGREPQVGNFQVCDAISVVNGQAAYTMQVSSVNVSPETANHMLVSLNGVLQKPGSSFTVSGSTITFASNLVTGDVIDFIHILGSVLDLGTPSDDTVATSSLKANSVTAAKFNADVISGQTALASEPADTDEFLVSDAGVLKRIDYSLIKGGGKVLQVVTATDSTTRSTTSTSFVTASSTLSLDITPSATSSKIFFIGSISLYQTNGNAFPEITIYRDSTDLSSGAGLGGFRAGDGNQNMIFTAISHLDSPSSTSEITYRIYIKSGSGDSVSLQQDNNISTFTAFEIGA